MLLKHVLEIGLGMGMGMNGRAQVSVQDEELLLLPTIAVVIHVRCAHVYTLTRMYT